MATYHLTLKVGAKGKAAPHFTYICAIEKYANKRGVVHIEHGNMPPWAKDDPSQFWKASDEFERVNGTVYRELEVSLPRELALDQQIELVHELAEEACDDKHAFSFAIHNTKASDGGMNPHVHFLFSERIDDGIERDPKHYFKRADKKEPAKGGCLKDRSWQAQKKIKIVKPGHKSQSSERLLEIRQSWEIMCNEALKVNGIKARIDHRSHADRGLQQKPQPKVGMKSWHLQKSTEKTDKQTGKVIPFSGEKNERFKRWEEVMESNRPILCDAAKLEHNKLKEHKTELIESRKVILKAISELNDSKPVIRTQDQIITGLLHNIQSGKNALSAINESHHKLKIAQKRYDAYCQIMDAPIRLSNIRSKFICFWNHASRAGEQDLLQQAEQSLRQSQKGAKNLLERAKEHPNMHAKAKSVMESEQKKLMEWQHQIDLYSQRLSEVDVSLQVTKASLKLLRDKYPEIKQDKQHDWVVGNQVLELALPQPSTPSSIPHP